MINSLACSAPRIVIALGLFGLLLGGGAVAAGDLDDDSAVVCWESQRHVSELSARAAEHSVGLAVVVAVALAAAAMPPWRLPAGLEALEWAGCGYVAPLPEGRSPPFA